MIGLLITNKYLVSEKFDVLKSKFIENASELNIKLDYMSNEEALKLLNLPVRYDFIIFYDKDIKLALQLEKKGYKVFNSSRVISVCDDKFLTYIEMENIVKQPLTIPSPFIYSGDLSNDNSFIQLCESKFSYPFIVKECQGSFGMQVYKVDNNKEFVDCIKKIGFRSFIVQEYIKTSFGKDVRVQVVGNKVICAMKRVNTSGDFRANVTNGAIAYNYEPSEKEKDIAIKAASKIGASFAGVDLLFGENDEPIFCEINSNAHLDIISKTTNTNVYKEVLSYIAGVIK